MSGRGIAAAASALALGALVTACEMDDEPVIPSVPGQQHSPELCMETTTCLPTGGSGTAYLVDELAFVAPDRLSTEFLRSHMAEAVNSGELVLVLHFQPATALHEPLLVAGPAIDSGTCHVFEDPPSHSEELELNTEDFQARGMNVRLLMHTASGEPVLDLVLPSSTVEGLFTWSGLEIGGGRGTGHGDMASIESVITADQARAVPMPLLGMTFCGLLSGQTGAIGDMDDDCSGAPETWPSPPSESLGGEPAYRIVIAFEAACIPLAIGS